MFARVGTWEGSSEELDRWVEGAKDVKARIHEAPGLRGAYWFADRAARRGLTITIWDSEDAMQISEERRARSQGLTGQATGAQVTTARYEVVESLERP